MKLSTFHHQNNVQQKTNTNRFWCNQLELIPVHINQVSFVIEMTFELLFGLNSRTFFFVSSKIIVIRRPWVARYDQKCLENEIIRKYHQIPHASWIHGHFRDYIVWCVTDKSKSLTYVNEFCTHFNAYACTDLCNLCSHINM